MTRTRITQAILFLSLIVSVFAQSQTQIRPNQIKGATSTAGQITVVLPNGAITQADLGEGVTLDLTGVRPVFRVTLPNIPSAPAFDVTRFVSQEQVTLSGANMLTCVVSTAFVPTSLQVFRNGLLQFRGLDYTVTGSSILFSPQFPPQTTDILSVSYIKQ